MDSFREEIIAPKSKVLGTVLYVIAWAALLFFAFIAVQGFYGVFNALQMESVDKVEVVAQAVRLVLFAGLSILLYWRKDFVRPEYEYTFTNGFTEIAAVYNNSRRKNLLTFKMKDVYIIAQRGDETINAKLREGNIKRVNAFLNRDSRLYCLYIETPGNRTLLTIEPSDEMLKLMKQFTPREAQIKL